MKLRLLLRVLALVPAIAHGSLTFETLEPRARELLSASLQFAERHWDEDAGLLWSPLPHEHLRQHRTRESAWYALGLLTRGRPGDEERAKRILNRVLSHQIDAPGKPWDGTFRRSPEEPIPRADAQLWENFDPNWRHFIGTTFAVILTEFEARLPQELTERLMASIRRSVQSELGEGRDEPYHTNIALMHAFLWNWAGARLGRAEWVAQSEAWARTIHDAFEVHDTFEEYNSPTYYGVDLYGLALWRRHGATEKIRSFGANMEAGLWRDIAQFYHAGLRNLCGPFDRAYGLDQRRYVSLIGIWMGFALPAAATPLPDPSGPMNHAHDFFFTPNFAVLGAQIPADILPGLRSFEGERTLERIITTQRTATAWLSRDVMLGGQLTQLTREAGEGTRFGQFHPATAHWRIGSDDVGAFALIACPAVDARASSNRLVIITAKGDSTFRLVGSGISAATLARDRWTLPNLQVAIDTDAPGFSIRPGEGYIDVVYRDASRFDVSVSHLP